MALLHRHHEAVQDAVSALLSPNFVASRKDFSDGKLNHGGKNEPACEWGHTNETKEMILRNVMEVLVWHEDLVA